MRVVLGLFLRDGLLPRVQHDQPTAEVGSPRGKYYLRSRRCLRNRKVAALAGTFYKRSSHTPDRQGEQYAIGVIADGDPASGRTSLRGSAGQVWVAYVDVQQRKSEK
jgi:hypothetical protein